MVVYVFNLEFIALLASGDIAFLHKGDTTEGKHSSSPPPHLFPCPNRWDEARNGEQPQTSEVCYCCRRSNTSSLTCFHHGSYMAINVNKNTPTNVFSMTGLVLLAWNSLDPW